MRKFYATLLTATTRLAHRCSTGDDEGATAVEYSLMVVLIAVVIIGAVTTIGQKVNSMFTAVTNAFP